jgi:hypothetical protein
MINKTLSGFSFVIATRLTRVTVSAVLVAMILATVGCGQETSPTAPFLPPVLSPPDPETTVPAATNGQMGVYRREVTMSRSGMATVTLKWPNADFSLQLSVTSGICADITSLLAGRCTILGSTRQGSLPGVVTSGVTGGDLNTIWVLNPDPFPQSFTVTVEIE